jgi:trans-aconitate 3-methyltransferase
MSNQPPASEEATFRSFDKEQGKNYAQNRFGYHPNLFKLILDHHTATGGKTDTIMDVGCGPGLATGGLALHFAHVIGIDPSKGMVDTAQKHGIVSATGESARFEISSAEALGSNLSPPVADSSIDLITAATAAHWFDMSRFWPSAARVLKPGGTVALWCSGPINVHPSMPNSDAIQACFDKLEKQYLEPYYEPGNFLARDMYRGLPMPWNLNPPEKAFDKSTFSQKIWDGTVDEDMFFVSPMTVDMDKMEMVYSTTSPIQRWRDAHPDTVGTENDVVKLIRKEVEQTLQEAGMEKGQEKVTGCVSAVLLMIKKKL